MNRESMVNMVKSLTVATFAMMIAANALANILPINGITTGAVSDSYPNLFAPAGITFSIWGLIYLLLAGYTIFHLGPLRGNADVVDGDMLMRIGTIFSVSSIANTAWILSWHYGKIALSMVLMLVILGCLILVAETMRGKAMSMREKLLVRLPFIVYYGWITVATIANATALLVSQGWGRFGIPETIWTVVIIIVGTAIGGATTIRNRSISYGLVIVWAYAGILNKHISAAGFAAKYPAVMTVTVTCIVLMLASIVYVVINRRSGKDDGGQAS